MAKNPMQKKARNSFILGMLITFIIMAMVVALLLVRIKNMKELENERLANIVNVYVLNQDVKSGQIITNDMLEKKDVNKDVVPANGTSNFQNLKQYFLEDKSGNPVKTCNKEEFLKKNNKEEYEKFKKEIQENDSLKKEKVLYLEKKEADGIKEYEIKTENNGEFQYIEIEKQDSNGIKNKVKEYVELATPPLIAKIDMKKSTVLTSAMLAKSDEKTTDDLRVQELNMIQLASQISADDYIDIRFRSPSGKDYIVVSKKKVEIPQVEGIDSANSIWLKLTEDEILAMSNAIVENYIMDGSILYTAKYVEPGTQEKAIPTYVPSEEVQYLMRYNDPNIVEVAKNNVLNRYYSNGKVRESINNEKNQVDFDEAKQKVTSGVKKEIEKAKAERQAYLDALAGN